MSQIYIFNDVKIYLISIVCKHDLTCYITFKVNPLNKFPHDHLQHEGHPIKSSFSCDHWQII